MPEKAYIDYPKIHNIDEKSKEEIHSLYRHYAYNYYRSENNYQGLKIRYDHEAMKNEGYEEYAEENDLKSCGCGRVRGYKNQNEMCNECYDRCDDCIGMKDIDNKFTTCKECNKKICSKTHDLDGCETDCNCNGLCSWCCDNNHNCDTCPGHNISHGKHDDKTIKMSFEDCTYKNLIGLSNFRSMCDQKYCTECLIKITNAIFEKDENVKTLPKDIIVSVIRNYLNEKIFKNSKKRKSHKQLVNKVAKICK